MIPLLIAGLVALVVSLVSTHILIDWLRTHRIGQPIREDGPQGHITKAGTPTMGGAGIVVGAVAGYFASHLARGLYFTRTGLLVVALIVGAGLVGLADDWIKVMRERNLGLNKRMKLLGLFTVAVGFCVLLLNHTAVHTEISFTRWNSWHIRLSPALWVLWAVLLIIATTNGSNLTDGLDGLNAGSSMFGFVAFAVIAFWAFRHPGIYKVDHALDIAAVAVAMLGACGGFLWWNAAPAQIFMGDTGSLAIGAGLAGLAITLNTHFLLPILAGLYVAETL